MLGLSSLRSSSVSAVRNVRFVSRVTTHSELKKAVAAPGNKVLYFTASWCPPCRFIAPIFEKLSTEFPAIKFLKIDIDENSDAATEHGISSVPTFRFFQGTTLVHQFSGANEGQLRTQLTNLNKTS